MTLLMDIFKQLLKNKLKKKMPIKKLSNQTSKVPQPYWINTSQKTPNKDSSVVETGLKHYLCKYRPQIQRGKILTKDF